jgi:hypothetical protein
MIAFFRFEEKSGDNKSGGEECASSNEEEDVKEGRILTFEEKGDDAAEEGDGESGLGKVGSKCSSEGVLVFHGAKVRKGRRFSSNLHSFSFLPLHQ